MTRSPGGFCRWGSFPPSHSFALVPSSEKRTSELPITVLLAHKFCVEPLLYPIGAIVGTTDVAAARAIAPEPIGVEAPIDAPIPAPPPNTSRPPLPIVSKPLVGKGCCCSGRASRR